jgi:hypothetical protein
MVGRDINWINLRWFNLGTGAESMTEMYFTVRGFQVYIIGVKCSASSDYLTVEQQRRGSDCNMMNFKHARLNRT